jgi:DNA-binding NtrC family response regulator
MAVPFSIYGATALLSDPATFTVLVADDDQFVRSLCRRGLETDGAYVMEAEDGEAALQLIQAYLGPIDLVITDLMMPRLGGHEVAEVLSVFRPGLPVLGMSGTAVNLRPDRRFPILAKPFDIGALIEAARETRRRARVIRAGEGEQRAQAKQLRQVAVAMQIRKAARPEEVDLVAVAHELRRAATQH